MVSLKCPHHLFLNTKSVNSHCIVGSSESRKFFMLNKDVLNFQYPAIVRAALSKFMRTRTHTYDPNKLKYENLDYFRVIS